MATVRGLRPSSDPFCNVAPIVSSAFFIVMRVTVSSFSFARSQHLPPHRSDERLGRDLDLIVRDDGNGEVRRGLPSEVDVVHSEIYAIFMTHVEERLRPGENITSLDGEAQR